MRFHLRCGLAMDVRATDEPPLVGVARQYAICSWVRDHPAEPAAAAL
jgi:hypothetical protein